tara:strand:+ start:155 stop:349 length:195 start_codon:yes stop_codon:yes gene_type:complete
MHTIKRISKDRIKLNGINYKGYMLGDLPPTFSYIKKEIETDEGIITDFGIREWFNYNGLTYIKN